jgi:MFS family permease
VAAITLPSLLTGPLLGAWLDLTGRRRRLMVVDQLLIASMLIALIFAVGHTPNWVVPLIVLAAGLTYPLSFGGFTSLIPQIVPAELLTPANALEASSFNAALVRIQRRFASERIVIAGYAWPVRWPSGSARRRRCCWRRPPSWWQPASGWP